MAKVIAVLNSKGGSGKSTISTNLASALHFDGYDTILADSDPQGTARDWRRVQEEDSDLPGVVGIDRPTLDKDIKEIDHAFDFVVIDGAAKLQEMIVSAVKAADVVLIPVQPSAADIWAMSEMIEVIKTRQQVTDGSPKACFVGNRAVVGTNVADEIDEALETFDIPILPTKIHQRIAYVEALADGSTVLLTKPGSKAAKEIIAVKNELLDFTHGKTREQAVERR
jgi:chromosome partitioning protein